jgi:hypothetical protein
MKDFLKRKDMFPEKLQWFVSSLADAISDRMKKIIENRILRIATLLDPRFAYDEELWTKGRWGHIEEQLIDFAKEGGHFLNLFQARIMIFSDETL